MPVIDIARWADHETWQTPLLNAILRKQRADPTSKLGVGGGWSSDKRFFDEPDTHALQQFIRTELRAAAPDIGDDWMELSGWANIMQRGDSVRPHGHELSHLGGLNLYAGVYYVTAPPASGELLVDGNLIPATPGLLVLFTADTSHSVREHRGDGPRVSVAFNVRVVAP